MACLSGAGWNEAIEAAINLAQEQRSSAEAIRAPLTNAAYDEACRDIVAALEALKRPAPDGIDDRWLAQELAKIAYGVADPEPSLVNMWLPWAVKLLPVLASRSGMRHG